MSLSKHEDTGDPFDNIMKVFTKHAEIPEAKGQMGLVPTMGALHGGHISLVEKCRSECDTVMVSIFVNPTQFNDPEDLKRYPRTPEDDLECLERTGADIVYMPAVEDVYSEPDTRKFDFGFLDTVMEGASRPGHFSGVAQVVSRLFDTLKPDKAYFGEKDFQQLAVIKKLVGDLGYDIDIVGCPIVREKDGLAMSSRNALLSREHRECAPVIWEAMTEARSYKDRFTVAEVKRKVIEKIDAEGLMKTEYFSLVDARTLRNIENWSNSEDIRACIAVQAGRVRLIDNIEF